MRPLHTLICSLVLLMAGSGAVIADPIPYEFSTLEQANADGVTMPVKIAGEMPDYPVRSRNRLEEGTVMTKVLVGMDGKVRDVALVSSSGHPGLDDAAIKNAKATFQFQPARRHGEIIPIWIKMAFKFTISQYQLDDMKAHPEKYRD